MEQISLFATKNIEIDLTTTRRNVIAEVEKYHHAKFTIKKGDRAKARLKATQYTDMPGREYSEYQSSVERAVIEAEQQYLDACAYVEEFDFAVNSITNYKTRDPEVRNRRREIFKSTFLKAQSVQKICQDFLISESLYHSEEREALIQFSRAMGCFGVAQHNTKRKAGVFLENE